MGVPIQVAHLIDPVLAGAHFRRSGMDVADVQPDYVRHKPGETTIISYRFHTTSGQVERGYAHWCEDPNRADEIWAKALTLKSRVTPLGTATQRLDRHTVFYPFPSDARLRRMRWYTTPRKFERTPLANLAPDCAPISSDASTIDVLRYKPERRVVAAIDLVTVDAGSRKLLVRYATGEGAYELAAIAHGLRAAGVATPEPLAQLEDGRVAVDEFIDGIELRSAVRSGEVQVDELATALVRFHRADVAAPARTSWDDLVAVSNSLHGLAAWFPSVSACCDALRRDLSRTLPADSGPEVLLHGDLHDNNIMITAKGTSFVDLERAARGPAAIDLGRFRGFTIGLSVRQPTCSPTAVGQAEAIVDRYRQSMRGLGISDSALSWHTAIAIVEQALLIARHIHAEWETNVATLLDLAQRYIPSTVNTRSLRAGRQ
jgi:aminoglycoside phosphotransferase (APT) family kinase protein